MLNWLARDRKFTKIVTNHLRLHEKEREGGREGEIARERSRSREREREREYIEGGREDMMT